MYDMGSHIHYIAERKVSLYIIGCVVFFSKMLSEVGKFLSLTYFSPAFDILLGLKSSDVQPMTVVWREFHTVRILRLLLLTYDVINRVHNVLLYKLVIFIYRNIHVRLGIDIFVTYVVSSAFVKTISTT